ncbi:MAG: superoxide dismutase family protein, partial [Neglectibacter sp.]
NHGYAWSAFLTSRFTIRQVLGRTLIIHGSPDDFTTQPAGNSGKRIACGEIR